MSKKPSTAMPLTRIVFASTQVMRGELPYDLYKLALTDFIAQLPDHAAYRLAGQISRLAPEGE